MFLSAPALAQTIGVQQAAAPVVQQAVAPVTQAAAPLVDAVARVADSSTPLADAVVEPVLKAPPAAIPGQSSSAATQAEAASETTIVDEMTTTDVAANEAAVPATGLDAPQSAHVSSRDVRRSERRPPHAFVIPAVPPPPRTAGAYIGGHAPAVASATKGVAPHRPAPNVPSAPTGLLAAIAAAFSSGASLIFVAALAAAVLLAAPGLSRRLRLTLAPWPLPIPLPSLERPG